MRRILASVLLACVMLPATWMRSEPTKKADTLALTIGSVPLSSSERKEADGLHPFRLEHVWQLDSSYRLFGGYSGLVALGSGRFMALSDSGAMLRFRLPGWADELPLGGGVRKLEGSGAKTARDFEALTADLSKNVFWASMEFENAIMRLRPDKKGYLAFDAIARPKAMAAWGYNNGPESLVRLKDGTFLVLREGFTEFLENKRHEGVRFKDDPIKAPDGECFTMEGPSGFRPTDMAQMPDGRVLILFRRVQWFAPPMFSGALAIGDPAAIRKGEVWPVQQVAEWGFGLPRDNFEGIAIEQGEKGRVIVWIISDDNKLDVQRTLLWKLTVDPKDLPDSE